MSYNNVNLISHYIYIMSYDMIYGKYNQNTKLKAIDLYTFWSIPHLQKFSSILDLLRTDRK